MVSTVAAQLFRAMLIAAFATVPAMAWAGGPQPPCRAVPGGDPAAMPSHGAMDGPPTYATWHLRDLENEAWQPPACLGWNGPSRMVVALASRFSSPASVGEVAEKLGSVSRFTGVKFWAITRQAWHPLALDAFVVANPRNGKVRLPDPPPDSLVAGRDYFYAEETDVAGRTVYRMRVLERTPDRLVMATENVTTISASIVTLFPPGSLQVVTFLDRDKGGWALYEITRAALDSSPMVSGYQSAYLNRLDAMRRMLAGIPTDRDPPIAKW